MAARAAREMKERVAASRLEEAAPASKISSTSSGGSAGSKGRTSLHSKLPLSWGMEAKVTESAYLS